MCMDVWKRVYSFFSAIMSLRKDNSLFDNGNFALDEIKEFLFNVKKREKEKYFFFICHFWFSFWLFFYSSYCFACKFHHWLFPSCPSIIIIIIIISSSLSSSLLSLQSSSSIIPFSLNNHHHHQLFPSLSSSLLSLQSSSSIILPSLFIPSLSSIIINYHYHLMSFTHLIIIICTLLYNHQNTSFLLVSIINLIKPLLLNTSTPPSWSKKETIIPAFCRNSD